MLARSGGVVATAVTVVATPQIGWWLAGWLFCGPVGCFIVVHGMAILILEFSMHYIQETNSSTLRNGEDSSMTLVKGGIMVGLVLL